MLVINLWGAPGCGKSTAAAYIFSKLKTLGYNVELVTEFAKDLTWEKRVIALHTQLYVSGVQAYRLARIEGEVDIAVLDSPLPSGLMYVDEAERGSLGDILWHEYDKYENINFYLVRTFPYSTDGRTQTMEESDKIGEEIYSMLADKDFFVVTGDDMGFEFIIERTLDYLKKENNPYGNSEN